MDRLRAILARIGQQLGKLTVTQRLLIGALCVVMLMTLFLISQYTGKPETIALFPTGASDDQQKAAEFLNRKGVPFTVASDGKVMLTPERKPIALAAMTAEQALPGDKKVMFDSLVANNASNWLKPLADKQMEQNVALQNELARVIRAMPGIADASVVVSRPPENIGLGAHAKKASAQVAVFPTGNQPLDQQTVNALADLVSASVSGLDPQNVAVIDGKNRRSYHAVSREDLAAGGGGSYIEQVSAVEKRMQEKLSEHLRYIPDVIVSVNAIVDAARREFTKSEYLPKGAGSVSMQTEETATTNSSQSKGTGAEPGVNSNVGMSVNQGNSASGSTSTEESSTNKYENKVGEVRTVQRDPAGRPTKINVTVSVPREYVAALIKQGKSTTTGGGGVPTPATTTTAEPTDAEIAAKFDTEVKSMIEQSIAPLVETESASPGAAQNAGGGGVGGQLVTGTVKAFLIPVSMASLGTGGAGAAGGGGKLGLLGGGTIGTLLESGIIKTAMLGVLAFVALGMMLMMVRKAGRAPKLPTAEELVGLPPALEAGTDVVGEAMEGDTAMQGIEIDDDALKTGKMLEEIGTLVKSNPQTAASVFTRWLSEES
ncbi:MAG TPA: flagellar M-ring protein FliF C-terminal domain-containing protein [Phycisphaerales bacterium]|nr:flagellar M-ring protein FliF C-terminal domain-containing protein [Phycisphaerales bacterium]